MIRIQQSDCCYARRLIIPLVDAKQAMIKASTAGFTLIEIVVVMVIVGLLTGIALPRLTALYASVENAGQRRVIQSQIEGLGYFAYANAKPIVLGSSIGGADETGAYPIQLPHGWQVIVSKPIHYSSQGICGGGTLVIKGLDGGAEIFRLAPPLCRLEATERDEG